MAKPTFVGEKWAAMELIKKESYTYYKPNPVNPRASPEPYPNSTLLTMACTCGNIVTADYDLFPSKKEVRDCGCGAGESLRAPRNLLGRVRSTICTIYMSEELHYALSGYAHFNRKSLSKAVVELLETVKDVWEPFMPANVDSTIAALRKSEEKK